MNKLIIPLVACIACAIIVSVTAVSVRPEQNLNIENEKKVKILAAAGIKTDKVDEEFLRIKTVFVDFETNKLITIDPAYDHIKAASNPDQSTVIPKADDIAVLKRRENVGTIYVWVDEKNAIEKLVLPIRGYGLWGTLYGYLSLDSDLNTVRGIEYYDHKETPGLGGEVDNPNWKSDWYGKRIYNEDGSVALYVTKGASSTDYEIDGISGATLTTNGVSNMIKYWLGDNGYGPIIKNLNDLIHIRSPISRKNSNLMTIHLMGSCPMGENESLCAVDSFGKLHGIKGLYIADASLLGGAPGVNPQGTIMALVRRNVVSFLNKD